jgi:hypothetical protein
MPPHSCSAALEVAQVHRLARWAGRGHRLKAPRSSVSIFRQRVLDGVRRDEALARSEIAHRRFVLRRATRSVSAA